MTASAGRSLLRRHAGFRRLWTSRVVSYLGDGIALVALMLHVQAGGSGTRVAGLLLAAALPSLFGPVAGTIADRVDRRRLMIGCELGQAACYLAIALWLPGYVGLLALVAAANLLARCFGPAASSSVPVLVPGEDLIGANAWLGTALNIQVAFGALIGGVLVAGVGVRWAIAIDAVSFLVSAGLLVRVPSLPAEAEEEEEPRGFVRTLADGIGFMARHRVARAVVLTLFGGVAFAAVDNVALVFLTRDELGGGAVAFGVVSSAFGFGLLAASLALTRWERVVSARAAFLVGWFLTAAGTLATGLAPGLVAVVGAQWLGGVGNGAANVGGDTLLQRAVPAAMRGRAFGLVSTAALLGSGLAYAIGGVLVDLVPVRAVFAVASVGVFVVSALAVVMLPRAADSLEPEACDA